jgi:hypothetical protein
MAEAFRHLVEYTIVMNRRVGDRTAIVFATAFYQALARQQTVRDAFDLAVKQLRIDQLDADAPELLEGITRVEVKPAVTKTRKKEPTNPGTRSLSQPMTNSRVRKMIIIQGDNNSVKG